MNDILIRDNCSNSMIVRILGTRIKEYRIAYRLTQKEMSERTGINVVTLRNFENGNAYNISMNSFISIMRVLGKIDRFEDMLPSIGLSVYEEEKILKKRKKRVRHGKQDS